MRRQRQANQGLLRGILTAGPDISLGETGRHKCDFLSNFLVKRICLLCDLNYNYSQEIAGLSLNSFTSMKKTYLNRYEAND